MNDILLPLQKDSRVDQSSLLARNNRIERLKSKGKMDDAMDLYAELVAAHNILKLDIIKSLAFGETPDINISCPRYEKYGIEVKRIRIREEDKRDEEKFTENQLIPSEKRTLVRYGFRNNNQYTWHQAVKDAILDKVKRLKGIQNQFLYLKSDSPHQVDSQVIQEGIKEASESVSGIILPFLGIFYQVIFKADQANVIFVLIRKDFAQTSLFRKIIENDNYAVID